MARIWKHGHEIGTLTYTTLTKRYMSDGKILKHEGHGWKIHGKVKPGYTPEQAYKMAKDALAARMAERPALVAYHKELHDMAGMNTRWKLHAAVNLMPDDPDGVWSEVCDGYGDNIHADIDEVSNLCRLYLAVIAEAKSLPPREPRRTSTPHPATQPTLL